MAMYSNSSRVFMVFFVLRLGSRRLSIWIPGHSSKKKRFLGGCKIKGKPGYLIKLIEKMWKYEGKCSANIASTHTSMFLKFSTGSEVLCFTLDRAYG